MPAPHAWLPANPDKQVLLDLLDDATRQNTGARLYPRETLLAHFDFLSRVFLAHGLPLALYVDFHSFFFTNTPDAFTQLGAALHFYGIALRYAPTPQAKGKIERRHDYWQKRLPPSWPRITSWIWKRPTACSTNSCSTPISTKSIANWVPLHKPPAPRPWLKTVPSCVPLQPARGGPMFGASKPASASAMTAWFLSVPYANPLMPRPVPKSSAACGPMATSSISAMPPIQRPNLSFYSIVPSSEEFRF